MFRRRKPPVAVADVPPVAAPSSVAAAPPPAAPDPWDFRRPYDFSHLALRVAVLCNAVNSQILEHIAGGDQTVEQLQAHYAPQSAGLLRALLRACVTYGVLNEAEGRYALTATGTRLLPGHDLCDEVSLAQTQLLPSWGAIPQALASGQIPFEIAQGMSFYGYMGSHGSIGAQFQRFIGAATSQTAHPLVAVAAPLLTRLAQTSTAPVVVDVGGASAFNMIEILRQLPQFTGIIVDMPQNLERAQMALAQAELADRCTVVGSDLLAQLPQGDVYLLSQILHNFPDDPAKKILANCAAHTPKGIMLFEQVLPADGPAIPPTVDIDLIMRSFFGAGERTVAEYEDLFASVGYHITDTTPAPPVPQWIVLAEPATA